MGKGGKEGENQPLETEAAAEERIGRQREEAGGDAFYEGTLV